MEKKTVTKKELLDILDNLKYDESLIINRDGSIQIEKKEMKEENL